MIDQEQVPDPGRRQLLAAALLPGLERMLQPLSKKPDSYTEWFDAIHLDDANRCRQLLERGFDPNTIEPERFDTGLILSVRKKSWKVFAALLSARGIDLNARSRNGDTALMIAAFNGDVAAANRLIDKGAEIIVATPGRLLDHMRYGYVDYSGLKFLVLDEADRMFDMGFLPDLKRIVAQIPTDRQTMLFSATMVPEVRRLADEILRDPATVAVDATKPAKDLVQRAFRVAHHRKIALLTTLLSHPALKSVIVFVKRKREADGLAARVSRSGRPAESIHADRSQAERVAALEAFRKGDCPVLIATDVAARGIDVDGITHVIHFDVPHSSEDYIHRSGRTARGGASGHVMTFVAPDEERDFATIEREIGATIQRVSLRGFDAGLDEARAKVEPERRRPAPRRRPT